MTASGLRVATVRGPRALATFIETAYRVHANDGLWVPPPRRDVRALLDRKYHPFHEHAEVEYFVAFRDDQPVGRIAAIENDAHNAFHGERIGFFGFLDAVPEQDVFDALLRRAEQWAAARGLTHLRGPCSPSTNEECGLLVQGHESPPFLMTAWNPESYPALVEGAGYAKARDMFNYWVSTHSYNPRMDRAAALVVERFARKGEKVTVRHLDKNDFSGELERVREVYNTAWEKNWGFVPMTRAEIDHMAKELKPVLVPEMVHFLLVNGKEAGFALSLPDYNLAMRHMEGRLGPRQVATFLLLKRTIRQIRVMAMGVKAEYRNRGLETLLVAETVRSSTSLGYSVAELGWILEDNRMMNRELLAMGGRPYKVHRIYEKALIPA